MDKSLKIEFDDFTKKLIAMIEIIFSELQNEYSSLMLNFYNNQIDAAVFFTNLFAFIAQAD